MGIAKSSTIVVALVLATFSAVALADQLANAQAAVAEAEKKLQHAIEIDPRVIAARRRLEKAQATLDESINLGAAVLKLATQRYQEAQTQEQAAVNAAAPTQRAELARLQKDLLAIRQAPPTASPSDPKTASTSQPGDPPVLEPQRTGDIEVRLLHARIAPVSYTPTGSTQVKTSDPLFGILIEVKNLGKEPVQYVGWNTNAFATDASDKQYLPAGVPGGTVLGRVVSASLPPGASVKDLIVLQHPTGKKDLTITLPAFNLGGNGAVQFHLTADKIELKSEPLLSNTSANPKVVTAPVPRPDPKPTTQVASGPPGASGRSADGIDFPPVTDPAAKKDRAHVPTRLPEVCDLLLYPPAKLGFPIFSVDKSAAKLKEPMLHTVAIPGVRARGVTHATRTDQDQLDPACQFFALNVVNAAVAGFEVRNGVIARIVLYYKRTDAAQRMLMISYGQAPAPNASTNGLAVEVGPWTCHSSSGGNVHDPKLNRDIWPILPQESPATIEVDVNSVHEYTNHGK